MNEEKKPKNPDVPCKGCERRCAVCHIKCPDYAEYKARLATLSAPIMRNTKHGLPDGRRSVPEQAQRIRHT